MKGMRSQLVLAQFRAQRGPTDLLTLLFDGSMIGPRKSANDTDAIER
jgi:hypothetical protein